MTTGKAGEGSAKDSTVYIEIIMKKNDMYSVLIIKELFNPYWTGDTERYFFSYPAEGL
jgi:hypothetical protein